MRNVLIFLFLIIGFGSVVAQSDISGCVRTSEGQIIEFANVTVAPKDAPKSFITSTLTNDNGLYSFTVRSGCDSLIVRASSMEIAPTSITIPNRSGRYDIVVEEKTVELKEVVVKSKRIYSRGDTINYNVFSFLGKNDQVLADVLKKMPGITVTDGGQVSYQGKPIKKFYIEGLDLMKGHYGIATNTIDPNNIATVQVLENHQDIKALKGLRPEEQASINIRLKEGVKGVFNLIGTIEGGYGDETLWNNSTIATYFKRSSQLLVTYKGNNAGEDLSQELYSFDNDYLRTSNIAEISMPSAPGIDKRFYYLNRSNSVTFNNVYRIGKSGEFGINAAYLNDRDTRQSYSCTANTLPDGSQNIVDERMTGIARTNKAYGDFTYLLNSDCTYLKEQLKFDWSATDADSRIFAGDADISQVGKTDTYRLLNKFHLTDRSGEGRGYEIYSLVNVEKRPHALSVSPNMFPEFIAGEMLDQSVDFRNISTDNRAGLLTAWKVGNVSFHPSFFIKYNNNSLTSTLAESHNDISLDNLSTGISTEAVWHTRHFDATLYIPFAYRYFGLKDKLTDIVTGKSRLRFEPQLDFACKISSNHSMKLKSAFNYSVPVIQNLYSSHILTSYRTLSAYDVTGLFEGQNLYSSVSYDFKDILSMSFAGLDLSWNRQMPDVLYGSYYDGLVARMISRRTAEVSDMLSAKIRGSQGFDWCRLKIGLSASYSYFESPLLVQDEVVRYFGNSVGIEGDISLSPWKWLSAAYEGKYHQSASRQQGFGRMPWLRTVTNKTTFDFILPSGISLRTSFYHYYNNFNDGDKSFLLLNAEARYSIKRFMFTLACDNLLNRKNYIYSNRSVLTETMSVYAIRPCSILMKIRYRIL